MLKPFYLFTGLVLLFDVKMWQTLPLWIHLLVFGNLLLAGVLTTLRAIR